MNQNLIKKLRCYIEFSEDEERLISSVFKLKRFAKGEHFLLAGDVCREAAFIESGVFRFYINTDERDSTYYFAAENEFICEYPSFLRQLPSDRNIQALEPAQIRVISFDDLQRFYREIVLGERFGRLIAEEIFIDSIQQLALFLSGQTGGSLPEIREPVSSTCAASASVLHRVICRYRTPVFEPHTAAFSFPKITCKRGEFY